MAIIQISKIQQRSGNLVDLPQLDQGELGWASDYGLLYIGKTATGGNIENVEVLTSYSNISFSQIDGSQGNLDISNVYSGQILTYVASSDTWVNAGGNALDQANSSYYTNTTIHLGNVSTLKIGGGGIGYVLETDGTGNLSWTPKGTIRANIIDLTPDASNTFGILANAVIMRVSNTTPYTNGTAVTITGANGVSNSTVNGNTFYVKVSNNFSTSGNVILFKTSDLANANALTSGTLTYTNSPNAIATTSLASGGSGNANAAGSNTSIQFNYQNIFDGVATFTFDRDTNILNLTGNANISNVNVSGLITVTGNVTGGNINTGGIVTATGNITGGNITTSGVVTATGNVTGGNISTAGRVTATGNVSGGNLITANGLFANNSFGTAGQVLTASNSNTAYWATTFYQGASPPAFNTLNYGDIFFYDDGNGFQRLYMWVYDASGDYFYDFLPPNF